MDRGHIVTARGHHLNMEELITKARRPMSNAAVDMKDTVPTKKQPARQLNIRGFMPSHEGIRPCAEAPPVQPVVQQEEPTGPSMADLTGVTVDSARHLRSKPEDPTATADEALREIMSDLEQFSSRDPVHTSDTNSSRRSKK